MKVTHNSPALFLYDKVSLKNTSVNIFNHPLNSSQSVAFLKTCGYLYFNVADFINGMLDKDREEIEKTIKRCLPKKWKDFSSVWMSIDGWNKISEAQKKAKERSLNEFHKG